MELPLGGFMGQFIIIVGPTASGKTRLLGELLKKVPNSGKLVTTTSRPPRPGEENGVHYHFIRRETFEVGIARGLYFEEALVHGNRYGSTLQAVTDALEKFAIVFAAVDVKGARTIKGKFPNVRTLFIRPGSLDVIERRLRTERKEASNTEIRTRLKTAKEELEAAETFDWVIDNVDGEFENTVQKALAFVNEQTQTRA